MLFRSTVAVVGGVAWPNGGRPDQDPLEGCCPKPEVVHLVSPVAWVVLALIPAAGVPIACVVTDPKTDGLEEEVELELKIGEWFAANELENRFWFESLANEEKGFSFCFD